MDLFKYKSVSNWSNGEAINGWDSVSWVERYRDPGEFEINAELSSGLKDFLPLGTFISHVRTLEVMVVEDHQITEEEDESPKLKITGRSIESVLDNRIVGQNQNWGAPPATITPYVLASAVTEDQVMQMINDHIVSGLTINAGDALTLLVADTDVVGPSGVAEARTIKRGSLLKAVLDILEIDDLGITTYRAHLFDAPFPGAYTILMVNNGVDRRDTIVFSSQTGDISASDYLWSTKRLKNAALVTGKFVETMVYGTETGMDRRVMFVEAQDIDGHFTDVPTGTDLTNTRTAMATRGRQALKAQKEVVLSRTEISENQSFHFRYDYNVGDIVSIDGSFGEIVPMRVVEYAEIVDENGHSGQPTLSLLEE